MIFAAYSCVEVFFTHLRTTEKAPLEGEGGKNWDTEQGRVTQTHFKSGDDDAPTTRPLVTRTHTGAATTTIQREAEGRGHRRSLNRCGWCAALPPPHPVPGQGNSLHLRLHIRSGWATLKTHTCCISDSPAVPAKRTRAEGSRQTLPFSHQEQLRVGEGEIKKRVSSPEREISLNHGAK